MSFWNTSTNQPAVAQQSFDADVAFENIPHGTVLTASIDAVEWKEYEGDRYINAKWNVLDGEHKGRILFHKIKVEDEKETTRDNALTMLACIDANTGGSLMRLGTEPSDMDLQSITNSPMSIKVSVWEMNGKTGNWVSAVGSLQQATQQEFKKVVENAVGIENPEDDIGF